MSVYDNAYQDGYAAALDDAERIPTERRRNGNDYVRYLNQLREVNGIEVEPRQRTQSEEERRHWRRGVGYAGRDETTTPPSG